MANKIDEIIDISISLSTKTITQKGFGIPLFLGESMKLEKRVKSYANTTEIAVDFAITDPEYKMALSAFSQSVTPSSVMIGKKVIKAVTAITTATNPSGEIVNINANGIGIEAETGSEITIAGFSETQYNGTFTITAIIDDDNIQYTAISTPSATPATGSGTYSLSETWSSAILNVHSYNQDWYALAITSNVEDDILNSASQIEPLKRFFVARSSDADNLDATDTGSVLYKLKALGYNRTALIYNADTTSYFADSAWIGRMLPTLPGSSNWAFKSLSGILDDNLSSTKSLAVATNNGNTYESIAGKAITRLGTVISGEYIDIIRGADWLQARIKENIYSLLINTEKIPYTNAGGNIIENKIREILNQGVNNGLIASNPEGIGLYTVTVPDVLDVPESDRLARLFSGVEFEATLAGAINKISIRGNLSV